MFYYYFLDSSNWECEDSTDDTCESGRTECQIERDTARCMIIQKDGSWTECKKGSECHNYGDESCHDNIRWRLNCLDKKCDTKGEKREVCSNDQTCKELEIKGLTRTRCVPNEALTQANVLNWHEEYNLDDTNEVDYMFMIDGWLWT